MTDTTVTDAQPQGKRRPKSLVVSGVLALLMTAPLLIFLVFFL